MQLSTEPDKRVTPFAKEGNALDTGTLYRLLKARGQQPDDRAVFVWQNHAPPRVQMFMCLLTQRKIQSRTNLLRRHVLPDATCEVCNGADESPEHIIGGCTIARQFWDKIGLGSMKTSSMEAIHNLSPPLGMPSQGFSAFLALACWQLWKTRNAAVFRHEFLGLNQVIAACKATARQWRCRFPRRKRGIVDQWCLFLDLAN